MTFAEFVAKPSIRQAWITLPQGEVYLRKSPRLLEGNMRNALVLANIEIKLNRQQQGFGSKFLAEFETVGLSPPFGACYVENIFSPILRGMLERRGFRVLPLPEFDLLDELTGKAEPPFQLIQMYKLADEGSKK
jgi:hypothetical protein